jgi:hypothetical protein
LPPAAVSEVSDRVQEHQVEDDQELSREFDWRDVLKEIGALCRPPDEEIDTGSIGTLG